MTPALDFDTDIELLNAWHHEVASKCLGEDGKDHLTKEFVDRFDCLIVMHVPSWIEKNWEVIKHKRVIWRTIGQSIHNVEKMMQRYRAEGLEIVRYSPMEHNIPDFAGEDALIRFYKDPNIYKNWTGKDQTVITFAQSMQQRGSLCNYDLFERTTRPFSRKLFGPENNQPGFGMGKVSFDQQLEEYRKNRCYFYTGTHPASYTLNFMESWMTGMPIVAIGSKKGNPAWLPYKLYEIPDLIQNGVNGFISDDELELTGYIRMLIEDRDLAGVIGTKGRESAIKHFGKEHIKEAWKNYLGD